MRLMFGLFLSCGHCCLNTREFFLTWLASRSFTLLSYDINSISIANDNDNDVAVTSTFDLGALVVAMSSLSLVLSSSSLTAAFFVPFFARVLVALALLPFFLFSYSYSDMQDGVVMKEQTNSSN
jgi:hypothetical protein